jgi:two-component system, chemotaxis family, protein-glutamate methylesterase/glutaminase
VTKPAVTKPAVTKPAVTKPAVTKPKAAATKALVCEDSPTYAAALRRVLEHDHDITVAATCDTAEDAIAALPRIAPDLVTMDLELPGMDGLRAVEEIMSAHPLPILMLLSTGGDRRDQAAAALAAGALDAIAKADLDLSDPAGAAGAALRQRVRLLSRARVLRHPRARLRSDPSGEATARPAAVIGVCASTGGPHVLAGLLQALPAGYPIPLLVVQHMTSGFSAELARWLGRTVRLPVRVVTDGEWLAPGAWIAPDGAQLTVRADGRLRLDRGEPEGPYRPSADVLFASIAAAAGRSGVAVVLTGMGADGAVGAAAVRQRGGLVIAQDEASSAIYGMPKAAAEAGAHAVLPPDQIADRLRRLRPSPLGEPR